METIFLNMISGGRRGFKLFSCGQHEDVHADQTLSIHSSRVVIIVLIFVLNIFQSQYLRRCLTVIHVGYSFWVYSNLFSLDFGFGRVALETIFLNTIEP